MAIVWFSLGSNLGNRAEYLNNAKKFIQQNIGDMLAESSVSESEAVGFKGNNFLNQVIKVETLLLPESVLQKTEEIERSMGRTQKTIIKNGKPVYSNRTIDIDILFYDDLQIDTEILTIPHRRIWEREFLMKLLKEIHREEN